MAASLLADIRKPDSYKVKLSERNRAVEQLTDTIVTLNRENEEKTLALASMSKYMELAYSTTERALAALGLSEAVKSLPVDAGTIESRRRRQEKQLRLMIATLSIMTEEMEGYDRSGVAVATAAGAPRGGMSLAEWNDAQPVTLEKAVREVTKVFESDEEEEDLEDAVRRTSLVPSSVTPGPQGFERPAKPSRFPRSDSSAGASGSGGSQALVPASAGLAGVEGLK